MNAKTFFLALVSGDETEIDSVVFGTLIVLLVFLGVTVYVAIVNPSLFSPVTYSTSALTIIGAGAGGKTLRDKVAPQNLGQ